MSELKSTGAPSSSSQDRPVYFWNVDETPDCYLSQWYPSPFTGPGASSASPMTRFLTTEQYMMYHKATLFKDTETAKKIMEAKKPAEQKALGRQVKGFNSKLWDAHKEKIVEEGNWHKFQSAGEDLRLKERLLATGQRELVEASPRDDIWGIGFDAEHADANRDRWGQNLLGKALMRVRARL